MVSPAKTMTPAPATHTYSTEANGSHLNGGSAEDNEREKSKCLSGFIFLCNLSTKLQCYQYRVFGLPLGKKEVVEEIKTGSKLFLFDFKSKLLYGVYEATCDGNLNLEPAAFGGQFPAQVKFKIFKECLPIPESSLRYVIKENYTGAKFKQELNGEQVAKLISSFRPLAASVCQPAPQAQAHVPQPGAIPPSLLEYQHTLTRSLPMMEVPYIPEVPYNNIRLSAESRPVLNVTYPVYGSHRRAAYVKNVHPTLDHQSLPAASTSYVAHPQRSLLADDVAHQESSYSGTIESGSQHAQVTSLERYTTMEQRASHDGVTFSGRKYHQLPLQREALYQDNPAASYYPNSTATDQYTPSVLPLQGRQYQDSIVAHSSNPAAPVQYTTSQYWQHGYEPYFPFPQEASLQGNVTAYNSNLIATAQYASSVLQTQAPVSYDQSTLRGSQYQDSAAAYSSNPQYPDSAAAYGSNPQYQDSAAAYGSNPQYPDSAAAYGSNPQYDSAAAYGSNPQYQDSAAAYGSNPAAATPYTTSVLQPQAHATYLSQQGEALYQNNVVPYNSYPTVPAQYTSVS